YRLFGQTRKISKEVRPHRDRLMGLAAKHRNATRYFHVGTCTIRPAKRVAGQRPGRRVSPGHDHATVQPTRQRHGHRIGPPKELREAPTKVSVRSTVHSTVAI